MSSLPLLGALDGRHESAVASFATTALIIPGWARRMTRAQPRARGPAIGSLRGPGRARSSSPGGKTAPLALSCAEPTNALDPGACRVHPRRAIRVRPSCATVVELGLPVLDTPMARRRLFGPLAVPLCADDVFAAAASRAGARLYSNSENAIGWIAEHLARSDLPRKIGLFKDKIAFRELVADLYPDYRFVGLPLSGLRAFDPSSLRAPFIVKPAVGFFSLGVHVVESAAGVAGCGRPRRARGRGRSLRSIRTRCWGSTGSWSRRSSRARSSPSTRTSMPTALR